MKSDVLHYTSLKMLKSPKSPNQVIITRLRKCAVLPMGVSVGSQVKNQRFLVSVKLKGISQDRENISTPNKL